MGGRDHIDSFVFDEYAFINQEIGPVSIIEHDLFVADRNRIFREDRVHTSGTADKRTPAIPAQALNGLLSLHQQYDAQLLPYPSHYLIARS
jgi:hypothetical protein